MNETLPIRVIGSFWLPNEPAAKVPGVLEISTSGDIKLELNPYFSGSFTEFRRPGFDGFGFIRPHWQVILGQLETLGKVTLYACHDQRPDEIQSLPPKNIQSKFALIGSHFEEPHSIQFDELRFVVQGLEHWLGVYGVDVDNILGSGNATIRFERPDDKEFPLTGGGIFKFFFRYSLRPAFGHAVYANASQIDYISLSLAEPTGLEDALKTMHHVRNFFGLAAGRKLPIQQMMAVPVECSENRLDNNGTARAVRIYHRGMDEADSEFKVDRHALLFNFEVIANSFADVIATWLTECKKYQTVTNFYFAAVGNETRHLDERFLILIQGLESLHRIENDPCRKVDTKARERIDYILAKFDGERDLHEWLSARLEGSYELTLRQRLKDLIRPFRSHFGKKRVRSDLIGNVVKLRDLLTHDPGKALYSDQEIEQLFALKVTLEILFRLTLLRLTGIPIQMIDDMVKSDIGISQDLVVWLMKGAQCTGNDG